MNRINFGVSPEKHKALRDKMAHLGIKDEEIEEKFIKSAGPGGQNVNKTATCVYIKHVPTGIEVKCQQGRSQALNRYAARKTLVCKIETKILGKLSDEKKKIEKIRRQKRRRSRRSKEKILTAKFLHSQKKDLRSRVSEED